MSIEEIEKLRSYFASRDEETLKLGESIFVLKYKELPSKVLVEFLIYYTRYNEPNQKIIDYYFEQEYAIMKDRVLTELELTI
jgi:hypothetical protein